MSSPVVLVSSRAHTTGTRSLPAGVLSVSITALDPIKEALVAAVAPLETGAIVNDHYSRTEYEERRGKYLDAAMVWDGNKGKDLSVQVVRQLELDAEIDPLLPLTTVDNVHTIDDHRSSSFGDWFSGAAPIGPRADSPTPPPQDPAARSSSPPALPEQHSSPVPEGPSSPATSLSPPTPKAVKVAPAEKQPAPAGEPVAPTTDESAPGAAASPRKRGRTTSHDEGDDDDDTIRVAKKPRTTRALKAAEKKEKAAADAAAQLEAVIAGESLPATEKQARVASATLLQRLTDAYRATLPRSVRGLSVQKGRKDAHEDFRPEFAVKHKHGKKVADPVRCVCGIDHDDGKHMVGCVGFSAADDEDEDGEEYRCQVCDPWGHKEMVAKFRKERMAAGAAAAATQ